MQLAFQTVALTTLFVVAASITALVTYKYASASVYYALQYPIPALCESHSLASRTRVCLTPDSCADAFSFIWSLETVSIARKKQQLPTTANMSSSRCSTCQNPNFGIWPYANSPEQVALPTLQQVLTRHEEPEGRSTHSQLSLSAFLKPVHHACKRSKAGKGSLSLVPAEAQPQQISPAESPTVQVDVQTVHLVEAGLPSPKLSTTGSAYFTPS